MKLWEILEGVRQNQPLVHCITNSISINDCANFILAAGAKPIMAEHPLEVEEITCGADSLVINLGNITDVRIKSAEISAYTADRLKIPFVIDIVGAACLGLRLDLAKRLITSYHPSIIKGNADEINVLAGMKKQGRGVDAEECKDYKVLAHTARELAQKYSCTVLVSGRNDVITDGSRVFLCKNGNPLMAGITGTGCIQGALCGACLSEAQPFEAALCGAHLLGICGEMAYSDGIGTGTFRTKMQDAVSLITKADFEGLIKQEEVYEA